MKKLNYFLFSFFIVTILFYSCDDEINSNTDSFKDERDGQVYKTVKIGKQTWMAENLKYLPDVVHSNSEFSTQGSNSQPGYGVYGYDGSDLTTAKANAHYSTYGVLYNWWAAMNNSESSSTNPSGIQGICPTGWHLPSDAEWTQLTTYLGDESGTGGKLKEIGTTHWSSPNTGATNETGFTALPGGSRGGNGYFFGIGTDGEWWSATEHNAYFANRRNMSYNSSDLFWGIDGLEYGFSVRCVKN